MQAAKAGQRLSAKQETHSLGEAVTKRGSAAYRAWANRVQEQIDLIYFDTAGWRAANEQLTGYLPSAWRNAWQDGIREFGLTMSDLTGLELFALSTTIDSDRPHLAGFISFVNRNRAATERPWFYGAENQPSFKEWKKWAAQRPVYGTIKARMRLWWNAYHRVSTEAKQQAAGDRPMIWSLGPTKENCRDCLNYNGRVYRASTWGKWDIRPQSPRLACHGVNCLCRLRVTTEPITPGRPPGMTG